MTKLLPENVLRDEDAMRAFYESCGIRKHTTEAAIKARRAAPVYERKKKPTPLRPKKPNAVA